MAHSIEFLGVLETLLQTNLEDLKMARTEIETGRVALSSEVTLIAQTVNGTYYNDTPYTYDTHTLEGDVVGISGLANLAAILKNLPDEGALDLDALDLEDFLKDWARDIAEDAEVPFTFEDRDGDVQTYTPQSLWESSGSCEWETSAQEGYDYGWNI
jgi:hypothetical protein